MSTDLRKDNSLMYDERSRKILMGLPDFAADFYRHIKENRLKERAGCMNISPATAYFYLTILRSFLIFLNDGTDNLDKFPSANLDLIRLEDIESFLGSLSLNGRSGNTLQLYRSALNIFFIYASGSGLISSPLMINNTTYYNKKKRTSITLTEQDKTKLLYGILMNSKYAFKHKVDNHTEIEIMDIDPLVRKKRDKLVLRNYLICLLFLKLSPDLTELASLNTDDIDRSKRTITFTNGSGTSRVLIYDDSIEDALSFYLDDGIIPPSFDLLDKSLYDKTLLFAHDAIHDPDFRDICLPEFSSAEDMMRVVLMSLNLKGFTRSAYVGHSPNKSLFLSRKGQRMSVRMIEHMVKDMAVTYLSIPDRIHFTIRDIRNS